MIARLRAKREEKGVTQMQLAEKLVTKLSLAKLKFASAV